MEFNRGDVVEVRGRTDWYTFTGEKGVIVIYSTARQRYGIDFAMSGLNIFHDLGGFCSGNTGYWVDPYCLSKKKKKVTTGFGRFIQHIENA